MEELLAVLYAGTVSGSSSAERAAAAAACRILLVALETAPGQPLLLERISKNASASSRT